MKKYHLPFTLMISCIFGFTACNDTDPKPDIESVFSHGVFILNEGNFSESDGSLGFLDLDSLKIRNRIFEQVNERPFAGILQSFRFYGGNGYLIDQLGRVEVVREEDLISVFSVSSGLDIPRYFAGHMDRGYVTDWGPYDENFANHESKIIVFDLGTMTQVNELETASRPEDILVLEDKIYVANSGADKVSVYDVSSNLLIDEVEVSMGPERFVLDNKNNLWMICTGAYVTTGALNAINTANDSVIVDLDLADYSPGGPLAINGSGDVIYFLSQMYNPDFSTENTIFSVDIIYNELEPARVELPQVVASGTNWYGIGVDPETGILYVADAAGFLSNGRVLRYDMSGNLIDQFDAGRGPRDFVFRKE